MREMKWKEGGLLEEWITARYESLFNARFVKLVQCLKVGVVPLCDVASTCDFECCD